MSRKTVFCCQVPEFVLFGLRIDEMNSKKEETEYQEPYFSTHFHCSAKEGIAYKDTKDEGEMKMGT